MGAWVIFRRTRIILFWFLVLACVTLTILLAVFISHEWSRFTQFQKIIVASLLSLYGFTTILLYLMIVTLFRLWWDVARVSALLFVHTGSSVVFTIYSPSFPCRGFSTETVCRKFVYTIFIGCWAFSWIIICFLIALGVMAFIPRPVESLQETEEVDRSPSPASFKAGSPTDEPRTTSFYSIDSRTGLVTYNNGGESPDSTPSPVNSAHGETDTMGPPRLWHGFERPNLMHSNNTYGGTMSMKNAPTEHSSVISGTRRVNSFRHSPLGNHLPPPASIYSQAPMTRLGVGGKSLSIAENSLTQSSAFPGLKRDALSPVSLHGSPPPMALPRDLDTEYPSTLFSPLSQYSGTQYSAPASPADHSQREQTYSYRARTATPNIHTSRHSAASVHPMWVEPTPPIPPLPVLIPDAARSQGSRSHLGSKIPSSGGNVSFTTSGLNAPPMPKLSEPHRTMQHHGASWAHQSYHPPVKGSSFSRRDNDGRVLDQTQWRRLILTAAAKP